jgi:hypothetical protein
MTNKELKMAIDRIAQIKIYKKEEAALREGIIAEFKRRDKVKINLGGPTKEDYVKINYIGCSEYLPCDYYYALVDDEFPLEKAKDMTFQVCKASKKMLKKYGPAHIVDKLETVPSGTRIQLSYRVSSDDKNMVRGIDL